MDEKVQKREPLEDDVKRFELDFQQIVNDMSGLKSAREVTGVFTRLHDLIVDAHTKNKCLAETVQNLNCQIVANATKVSALLKMSDEDHKSIERYREEFNNAWNFVTTSQVKEASAKDICESLKDEVTKLSAMVHEQMAEDNATAGVHVDLKNFEAELKSRVQEINSLKMDIAKFKKALEESRVAKEKAEEMTQTLQKAILDEEATITAIMKNRVELSEQIDNSKEQYKQLTATSESLANQVVRLKRSLLSLRQEAQHQRKIRSDCGKETEAKQQIVRLRIGERNRILGKNDRLERSCATKRSLLERDEMEIENMTKKMQMLDEVIADREREIDEIDKVAYYLRGQISGQIRDKKEKNDNITSNIHQIYATEAANITATRVNDARARDLQTKRVQVKQETEAVAHAKNLNRMRGANIKTVKNDIQRTDLSAASIEKETKTYQDTARNLKVKIIRVEDTDNLRKADMALAEETLKRLQKSSKDQHKFIEDMRHERDTYSNKIDAVVKENEQLTIQLGELQEDIKKLKKQSKQKTRDAIETHFATRAVEKQILALHDMIELTSNLNRDSTQAIIGYEAEGMKLRRVLDEALTDIHIAKTELTNLEDLTRMMKTKVSMKNSDTTNYAKEHQTLQDQIQHNAQAFETQSDMIEELQAELDGHIQRYRYLHEKAEKVRKLKLAQISLETRLTQEREIVHQEQAEACLPRNVHRWTVLKMMDRSLWNNIQLLQYIKTKMEKVDRKQLKLNEEKQKLTEAIKNKTSRTVRSLKVDDSQNAVRVYQESLRKKEIELQEIKQELDNTTKQVQKMAAEVETLKQKIKTSHITTTTIKRQKQQQFPMPTVPVLQIGTRTIERSRLGGGFSLNSERSNSSARSTFVTQKVEISNQYLEDEDPIISARPKTSFTRVRTAKKHAAPAHSSSRVSNFRTTEENDVTLNVQPTSARRAKDPFATMPSKEPPTPRRTRDLHSARTIRVKRNGDTSLRPPTRQDDTDSTSRRDERITRVVKHAKKTKTDKRPIGPYFGPL